MFRIIKGEPIRHDPPDQEPEQYVLEEYHEDERPENIPRPEGAEAVVFGAPFALDLLHKLVGEGFVFDLVAGVVDDGLALVGALPLDVRLVAIMQ